MVGSFSKKLLLKKIDGIHDVYDMAFIFDMNRKHINKFIDANKFYLILFYCCSLRINLDRMDIVNKEYDNIYNSIIDIDERDVVNTIINKCTEDELNMTVSLIDKSLNLLERHGRRMLIAKTFKSIIKDVVVELDKKWGD